MDHDPGCGFWLLIASMIHLSGSISICAIQAGAQLCVFCLRLPVDGNIGVGILP
jgi:hypothetical protein